MVSEYYHISKEDIIGKKRNDDIVLPRKIIMYLCRKLTYCTLVDIGRAFGDIDPYVIMHCVKEIENALISDEKLQQSIDTLLKILNMNEA